MTRKQLNFLHGQCGELTRSANNNPRGLSDKALAILILEDHCPMCLGELDTGWECNDCGYDAKPIADRYELDERNGLMRAIVAGLNRSRLKTFRRDPETGALWFSAFGKLWPFNCTAYNERQGFFHR